MTCDSDGKIDRFVGQRDIERALPVHELVPGQDYYLGVFFTGAYQETLGDLHNLFGDTHVVHVALDGEGRVAGRSRKPSTVTRPQRSFTYLQYDVDSLWTAPRGVVSKMRWSGRSLNKAEAERILAFYRDELEGYTYLEPESAT